MTDRLEHLHVTEKLFRQVTAHLQRRIRLLASGVPTPERDEDLDLAWNELPLTEQTGAAVLRLELVLYSLCLDHVRAEVHALQGTTDPQREHARANFHRLMATLAKAELARDAHARSFGFADPSREGRPFSDAEAFSAIEAAAQHQAEQLLLV